MLSSWDFQERDFSPRTRAWGFRIGISLNDIGETIIWSSLTKHIQQCAENSIADKAIERRTSPTLCSTWFGCCCFFYGKSSRWEKGVDFCVCLGVHFVQGLSLGFIVRSSVAIFSLRVLGFFVSEVLLTLNPTVLIFLFFFSVCICVFHLYCKRPGLSWEGAR